MTIVDAQGDLRRAFVGGGPGLVVSGLFWIAAGLVAEARGVSTGYLLLFITGALIFPAAMLACRVVFKRRPNDKANPLGRVALESTIAMVAGIVIAHLFLNSRPEFVFPIVAIAVGTHFFAFRTAYGDARFWGLAALVTVVGAVGIWWTQMPALTIALGVAACEFAFGVWLTLTAPPERAAA